MTPVEPTIGLTVRFLWAITWRNLVAALIPIFVTGIATAAIVAALGYETWANPIARLATLLVSLAVSVPVTRSVFGKQLGKYKVVVVKAEAADVA
jgi:hypothetical protein